MATKQSPVVLTREHYDSIQDALRRLGEIDLIFPKAAACGVDCAEYRKIRDQAEQQLNAYLKAWFPKGRPK